MLRGGGGMRDGRRDSDHADNSHPRWRLERSYVLLPLSRELHSVIPLLNKVMNNWGTHMAKQNPIRFVIQCLARIVILHYFDPVPAPIWLRIGSLGTNELNNPVPAPIWLRIGSLGTNKLNNPVPAPIWLRIGLLGTNELNNPVPALNIRGYWLGRCTG